MKKVVTLIFLLILLISTAYAVEYTCPNPGDLKSDTEEIEEGKTDKLKGLPIGICGATENLIGGYIATTVFIDANLVTISGNLSTGTELVSGNDTISASDTNTDNSKINIGGSSETLDLGDCEEISSNSVMLTSISGSGSSATVKVLVSDSEIILDSSANPGKIIDFNSKKYAVAIVSGSNEDTTIQVSTCDEGDITEIETTISVPEPQENNITGNNHTNQTQQPSNNTLNQSNQSQVSQPPTTVEVPPEKVGFFQKFWEWIKGIFS
jgi:hypothetical protein